MQRTSYAQRLTIGNYHYLRFPKPLSRASLHRSCTESQAHIVGIAPTDDPALHQGRKRTRPYVEGDYDTHIYISRGPSICASEQGADEVVEISKRLSREVRTLEEDVRRRCPDVELHSFLDKGRELHVSLTHPFPLRRHQIALFRSRLTQSLATASGHSRSGVALSLGGKVRVYYNGKRYGGQGHGGRAFLALRVTSGFREVRHFTAMLSSHGHLGLTADLRCC